MPAKPVTVDFLHPAVTRTFNNWGYISFFGCMALLIALMFFAISSARQTYAAREKIPLGQMGQTTQNIGGHLELLAEGAGRQPVTPPFIYRNEELGFSIDYSSLAAKAVALYREQSGSDGYKTVAFWDVVNSERGLVRPILWIKWIKDSHTLDQYEADERARVAKEYAPNPELNEFSRLAINGVDGLLMAYGDGECGGTVYTTIKDSYRVSLEAQCSWDRAAFSRALQTMRFE